MNNCEIFILVLSIISLSVADVDDPTLVTLPEGEIRGQALLSPNENVYYAFQDIPYAAPPVGKLRFQPPSALERWEGVLNTTKNEKICYQGGTYFERPGLKETEDCLYLNVFTPLKPGDSSDDPLPVLVWIHGGWFHSGSGATQLYKPEFFVDHNIIVVTINYRLGTLGFLTTEDEVIPGNLGLKDQQFAIEWVNKNIDFFGGDPEKITISGESAGSVSVAFHSISEKNKGLFRGAILQSGTAISQRSHQSYARYYAFKLGQSLDSNFTSDNSEDLLKLLQDAPASDINNNTITVEIGKGVGLVDGEGLIWLPVIEDANLEGSLITGPLLQEDVRNGNINQVPTLIGFNSEEQLTFMSMDSSMAERQAKYLDTDASNLIGTKFNMTNANKATAGTRLKEIYTDGSFADDLGAIVKFSSDESFSTTVTRHAKLQSNYTDVYLYQFSYKGKLGGMIDVEVEGVQGVGHGEELGYLWDTWITDGTPDDPEDLLTRHRLLTLWSNFVKYSNPTPEKDSFLNNVTWEKVSPNNLVYLNINNTLDIQTNPKEYLRWERIIDIYAIPPLANY